MKKDDKNIINEIEKKIGIIMRIGVGIAAVFMIFGALLLLITYKNNFAGFSEISISEIFKGLFTLSPYSYMLTGIFILILTPVIRVVSTIVLFAKQKDMLYTGITILVLIILLISFIVALIIH